MRDILRKTLEKKKRRKMTLRSKRTSLFGGELGATTSSALRLNQIQHSNNLVKNVNLNDYEDLSLNYSKYNYFIKNFEFFNEDYLTFYKKFTKIVIQN